MSRRTRGGVARAIRVGAAVAVAGIAGAAPAAAAPSWLGTQTLGGADAAAAPQAAADAAGDALVAYTDDAGVVRATTRLAGAASAWGAPASLGSGTVPRLAMNASGRAVVAYRDAGGTISAAVRDDVAGAWSAPVALTASPVPAGVVVRVAIDAAGDAVAAWNTSGGAIEAAARPAGGAWGSAEVLCTTCDKPALAIDADGNAVAAWVRASRGESRIRPAAPGFVSAWGGATWSTPTNVTPIQPQLAMDGRGTTLMVFRDQVGANISAIARPGAGGAFSLGASWSAPQVLSVPGENVDQPQVAMDGSGDAVVAWRHVSGPATVQAVSRAADDPWSGWTAPQNLLVTASPVSGPQVTANAAGDVAVTWEQATATAAMASVRPASAGATAAFPAASELASGAAAVVGPVVALDPAGNALAAWREDGVSSSAVRAAAWDAAGPTVSSFTGPSAGTAGDALAFAATTDDVWSPLGAAPAWDFGDGTTGSGASVTHAWSAAGTYTVTMTRADILGNATTRTRTVTIAAAPAPPAPPPSGGAPAPSAPSAPAAPAPAPPVTAPSPAPAAPRMTALAVTASGRTWTATFRSGTQAVVRGRLVHGRIVRSIGPRTVAAGGARVALGRLAPGAYRLTLTATTGGRTVTATKAFTVRAT
ncbi:MAG TPA: PKD domain-containing protein [Miltoncostaeaceae bacterium]|mgnify:CR=1 FL=1|nr:PKD domain-containing protein [Miltoncostaeaceae bacterium]